jgi:hypothetical protein
MVWLAVSEDGVTVLELASMSVIGRYALNSIGLFGGLQVTKFFNSHLREIRVPINAFPSAYSYLFSNDYIILYVFLPFFHGCRKRRLKDK